MKEPQNTVRALPQRSARRLGPALERPAVRAALRCAGRLGLGLLLSGGSVAGRAMPFAVCLIAASRTSLEALSAALGALVGYFGFWGLNGGLEYAAVSILVFAAYCIVGDAGLTAAAWFMPAMTGAMCALVGLLFLLQARFAPSAVVWYVLRLAAAAGTARAFALAARRRREGPRLFLYACALSGCAALRLVGGVTVGQILAVAVSAAAPQGLLLPAVSGLALDITTAAPVSMTALLCFAWLTASLPRFRYGAARVPLFLVAFVAGVVFTGGQMPELAPAAALGCCLSFALPPRLLHRDDGAQRAPLLRARLERAAALLEEIHDQLDRPACAPLEADAAAVFDRASERVCACCVLGVQCWQQRGVETYRALCAVAPAMLARGAAVREDFPAEFLDRCCRLDSLMAAINRELDGMVCRRQTRHRLAEGRAILSGQYAVLSAYLRKTAQALAPCEVSAVRYAPELGIGAAGRHGSDVSGDRSACLRTAAGMYYLLLCDGMGAGDEAAEESAGAVRLLSGLLRAGLTPQEAMQTLNGVYVLRGDGVFSTLDLAAVDLHTGEALLYKWGAAPSYLKRAAETQKIGTAAPPPGLGVGEAHKAAEYRLSLCEGEMLVLLSDGAGGEEAGRQITDWADGSPKALAAALLAQAQADGEDDMTVLALRLRPCT